MCVISSVFPSHARDVDFAGTFTLTALLLHSVATTHSVIRGLLRQ